MPSTFVHFQTLSSRVASHPNTPVFKLPKAGAQGHEWVDVSYAEFQADIDRMAKLWSAKLSTRIPPRSVVGIWLPGYTYTDVITVYAISRAGFIPQMFGSELSNTRIVFELLSKYDGKAIIHDPATTALLAESKTTLLCHIAVDYRSVTDIDVADLELPELPATELDDVAFIYHSSGSVSGMPKVIPTTNKSLSAVEKKSGSAYCIGDFETQDVYAWTVPFSRCLVNHLLLFIMRRAACFVQPTRFDLDSRELAAMIREANVNRIIRPGRLLHGHLEDARAGTPEPDLLALLKASRQVTYLGMPLATELEDWAAGEGIPLTNTFGCTECGPLLTSAIGDRRLKMLPNISYKFTPVDSTSIDGTEYSRLLELWILPDSPDLPVAALRSPGGGWRSGDLFEEVEAGKYVFRGRDNDWIKSQSGERLDTKSIEDDVYTTCSDIVANCVVVGSGRPYPALFVEPRFPAAAASADHALNLKREIIERTSDFHSGRCLHKRIQDERMIEVVPAQSLPRTAMKRIIRRHAVEREYGNDLEKMYASMATQLPNIHEPEIQSIDPDPSVRVAVTV